MFVILCFRLFYAVIYLRTDSSLKVFTAMRCVVKVAYLRRAFLQVLIVTCCVVLRSAAIFESHYRTAQCS